MSPRGGGDRLSEVIHSATGIDLIKLAVKAALGKEIEELSMPFYNGFWSEIILHADENGGFKGIEVDVKIEKENLIETDLWVQPGDQVKAFNAANDAIGTLILRFNSEKELGERMDNIESWVRVIVD